MSFIESKRACAEVLAAATKMDDTSFLAVSIIFEWLPRLPSLPASGAPKMIEDTFVHQFLDALFTNIFGSEQIFDQEWANGFLETSRTGPTSFKPDWVAFVKPRIARFDLSVYLSDDMFCLDDSVRSKMFKNYQNLGDGMMIPIMA
ncbi:hypothetical protein DM01DRAFT_326167 [Hesseltinella vesiculosa]|uniref:Uncharacterized protein n=1 Tax=Hesseltinella vesiculosa TaxID=101127 RepID=A0A1X2GSG5_9FUNG|nr:hypothetical protein DM01DRAFT_326167 [Hesseltinella vesiculosa]